MALYSIVLESSGKTCATQIRAESVKLAFESFLDGQYNRDGSKLLGEAAPSTLSSADIFLLTEMTGLTNMWIGQAGRDGKYLSAIISRTVTRQGA